MEKKARTSALIVFETLPPYGREAVTMLALPRGCRTRFRFKLKWFNLDDPHKLKGMSCLIALRHTANAFVIPLRICEITSVEAIGEIYYLIVTLQGFIEYNTGSEGQVEQLDEFQRLLRDNVVKNIENLPGIGMGKLVFITHDYSSAFGNPYYTGSADRRHVASWGTIVERLIQLPEFEPLDFLYISFLGEFDSSLRAKNGRFTLSGKRYYRMTVIQRRKNVEPAREITLRLNKNQLTPVLDRHVAVGAYDVLEFSFYTAESGSQPKQSSIVLSENLCEADLNPYPYITIPVTIKAVSIVANLIPALIFIVIAFTLLAPAFVATKLGIDKAIIVTDLHNVLILAAILTASSVGRLGSLVVNKSFVLWK